MNTTIDTRERPILFSGPMVRAILEGRKTQTRRVIKPQPIVYADPRGHQVMRWRDKVHTPLIIGPDCLRRFCPYGAPGDRLWVRETWLIEHFPSAPDRPLAHYRADDTAEHRAWSVARMWKPSIHMPRAYSRLTLEVTSVRVERVTDISNGDAYEEGFGRTPCAVCDESGDYDGAACFECSGEGWHSEADNFRALWDTISGARPGCAWADNPWVWVVAFRRLPL